MEVSGFLKGFRVFSGGLFLGLAYLPLLLNSSYSSESGEIYVSSAGSYASPFFSFGDAAPESIFDQSLSVAQSTVPSSEIKFSDDIFRGEFESKLRNEYFANASSFGLPLLKKVSNETTTEVVSPSSNVVVASQDKIKAHHVKEITAGALKGGKFVKGTIKSNFYADARHLGVPAGVVDKVIKNLASKVDFRRSLKKGDSFEIAFSSKNELMYSRIKSKRTNAAVYKFGKEGYFFENGEKVAAVDRSRNSFGSPVRGRMSVSSGYGYRRHPVTGRYAFHSGVDISANHGTPVYAVFDGVVTRASGFANYGRCVDIKHRQGYSSRYAHLSRFAVRPGAHVKKGQLIGYSGATGRVTGPHLHLEMACNDRNINPLAIKMMPQEVPSVLDRRKFNLQKKYFQNLSASMN